MLEELLKLFGGQGGGFVPPQRQPGDALSPSELGVPQGGLMALLGGQQPQQAPQQQTQEMSAQSRQPSAAPAMGGGINFGDMLARLGPALMMMSGDQNYTRAGAVMAAQNSKNKQTAQEQQQTQARVTQTYQWLVGQGMNPQQAAIVAQDPTALREHLKPKEAEKPVLTEIFDEKTGQPRKVWVYPSDPSKTVPVGGAKNELLTPDQEEQKIRIARESRPVTNINNNMNATEATMAGFADRLSNSERILREVETAGTSVKDQAASSVPLVGNFLTSDKFKAYDQARRDFVNAVLRRESGAVISPSEFANAEKQYFPQPGDGADIIAQKQKNREVVMQGIMRAAGSNYKPPELPGVTGPGNPNSGWTDIGGGVRIREKK